ncbi:hypothetical protein CMUS01_11650 [Colletotrichum musicola]|uniref:Uncharacterized protein n=1 Tax=Colletotrichum musicola TaxID=2175873 RepID=A0A8H6JV02_9PEZI|nr:hypothetical protein CMUS01_11650 [Colletotrichum musicola]
MHPATYMAVRWPRYTALVSIQDGGPGHQDLCVKGRTKDWIALVTRKGQAGWQARGIGLCDDSRPNTKNTWVCLSFLTGRRRSLRWASTAATLELAELHSNDASTSTDDKQTQPKTRRRCLSKHNGSRWSLVCCSLRPTLTADFHDEPAGRNRNQNRVFDRLTGIVADPDKIPCPEILNPTLSPRPILSVPLQHVRQLSGNSDETRSHKAAFLAGQVSISRFPVILEDHFLPRSSASVRITSGKPECLGPSPVGAALGWTGKTARPGHRRRPISDVV